MFGKFKVKAIEKTRHGGQLYEPGTEFTWEGHLNPNSGVVELIEVLEEAEAPAPVAPVEPAQELPSSEDAAKTGEEQKVIQTQEGTEIVDSFPMGGSINPAAIKARINEVEKAEDKGQLKVEEGGGAPAGERFQVVKKSGKWHNVVDIETGAVLNEKGLKKEDALAFKTKLIESSVSEEVK